MFDQLLYEAWPTHGNAVGGRKQQRHRAEPDGVFAEEHLAIIREPAARAGKKARAAPVRSSADSGAKIRQNSRRYPQAPGKLAALLTIIHYCLGVFTAIFAGLYVRRTTQEWSSFWERLLLLG
jgi:hypothetical protein